MNPTQKQFSLNPEASKKQIPISNILSDHLSRRQFLCRQSGALLGLMVLPIVPALAQPGHRSVRHTTTDWAVEPSFIFDTLCVLNTLSADPFYLEYYRKDYALFEPQLTSKARQALANIKRLLKDDNGNIVSAFLCLHFSATTAETIDDLIHNLDKSAPLKNALKRTPYYNESGWKLFTKVRSDLRIVFGFLKDIKFEAYWRETILPKVRQRLNAIEPTLSSYNVVAEDEAVLGIALPSNKITVYMLYFNMPHGMRLTGTRFVSGISWPLNTLVNNAAHELMHPPYDLKNDRELRETLALFQGDTFVMGKVKGHDPSFGYNSLEGYLEENCVRALDQLVTEKLKVARDPHSRWKEEDGGMHVFAAALYSVMKKEQYPSRAEPFRDFLIRMIRTGKLAPGQIRSLYDSFYAQ